MEHYTSGAYFDQQGRHSEDADFKHTQLCVVLDKFVTQQNVQFDSYADVGCGAGHIAKRVADSLRENGHPLIDAMGYDVYPNVEAITHEGVRYICEDFCQTEEIVDFVTLFDVFEHVLEPVQFLKSVGGRSKVVGLHIPLDNSLLVALSNGFQNKLQNPGHLIFLDVAGALNMLALAGLRVVDYCYTPVFMAPSGQVSAKQRLSFPLRKLLFSLNPFVLSKTMGGVSLMVLAVTKNF
jgi:hypothetical protein